MKKAIMEVEDFDKITKFITSRSVTMMEAERAVEIINILKRTRIEEVHEDVENNKSSTDGKK